ncbi:MAG: CHAT domain-containing protein [Microcoleaceae cyanobacterium]
MYGLLLTLFAELNQASAWPGQAVDFPQQSLRYSSQLLNPGDSEVTVAVVPPTIEQIKQVARQQRATLVQYSLITDETLGSELRVWVVQSSGRVELRRQSIGPQFEQWVDQACQQITSHDPTIQLQQLYQVLIQPIVDLLPTASEETVVFIPQGSLFKVPFAALADETGQYLIEQYVISTAPAIQILELIARRQQQDNQFLARQALVIGSPSESETTQVADLLATQALQRERTTKSELLATLPTAQVIHFVIPSLQSETSAINGEPVIQLKPEREISDQLTTTEIQNLELDADLVVLSGDRTALGPITTDGVIGLPRAFIVAGVPSVVASLWLMPDRPTQELMVSFYQSLQENPNKAIALRQAMLETMARHPHPRNWAGLILIGIAGDSSQL